MTDTTTRLSLPLIAEAQAQKHVTHNEGLLMLDALVQAAVKDRDLTTPPATPAEGEAWIVAAGATDAWSGQDNAIAVWQNGAWRFFAPAPGWRVWIEDEGLLAVWDGSAWIRASGGIGSLNPVDGGMVGINTTADATNRLAVKSDAVLFSHDDVSGSGSGDVRLTINKAAAANTASLLFQDGFSGRAELGLSGDDDFRIKVSPDGTTWHEALAVDRNDGSVTVTAIRGDGSGLTNVNAERLGGDPASAYAKLSGAVFTGGVTAAGFTGDGGGLTNVNADYLGGRSPDAYALLSGADFTGAVSAASFSGDGSGLSNVDAERLGGDPASAYARLSGAVFTGKLAAPRCYLGLPAGDRGASGGTASFEMGGRDGSWSCNVQDGSGRVNFRWNATAGPRPKFLLDGDQAVEWDIDGNGGFGFSVRVSQPNPGAGADVTWWTLMSVGGNGAAFSVPVVAPAIHGDGSGLTNVNAERLGGDPASAYAKLSGAVFTGGVTAAGFTGDGGGLTNVNADYLGGKAPSAYALLSGADFTGAVSAASFSGDGSGLTNVDAERLGGRPASDYALAADVPAATRLNPADGGMVGINTTADATNRLAVKSDAVLFSHDDVSGSGSGDVRVTVNKASASNAAGIVFQDGFSGRAELGLSGDDDFRIKVSPDGTTWHEALAVDRNDGSVTVPAISGDGSGLTNVNAERLGGDPASAYAKLSGAVFTGGVTAAGFTGDGGGLTNVNADYLGGKAPSAYALLSGADFTGAVSAASFSGDGSGLTNVDADTVDGRHADEFALLAGATFAGSISAPKIGVQTAADDTNRLAVKSDAVLFSHDDVSGSGSGDVRFTVNKAASANTASLLFQSAWSGRAELGLTGDDDFRIKVSADGATWREMLVFTPTETHIGGGRIVNMRHAYIGDLRHRKQPNGNLSASLEIGGPNGSWICNVQDGSGRVNYRWNASSGPRPVFLVDGDRAIEWDMDHNDGSALTVKVSQPNPGAGTAVIWEKLFQVAFSVIRAYKPLRLPSYSKNALPSAAAAGAGALIFVSDEAGGPTLAFSDGTAWRRVQDRAVVS